MLMLSVYYRPLLVFHVFLHMHTRLHINKTDVKSNNQICDDYIILVAWAIWNQPKPTVMENEYKCKYNSFKFRSCKLLSKRNLLK